MLDRRGFLTALLPAGAGLAASASAVSAQVSETSMRGSLDASVHGMSPGAMDDQSRAFQRLLDAAAANGEPVFLPPGDYVVSNIILPKTVRLAGVPGSSRIIYGGNGHLFSADDAELITINGIVIDGGNRWLADQARGIVELRGTRRVAIDTCEIFGSSKYGLVLERSAGRVERTSVSGALDAGIYCIESRDMTITGNTVSDCGNGGILVHRWSPAHDGTMVTANRIRRIGARSGGTGQNGNGINVFRANGVMISANEISDCAFSAIRSNSGSNLQIAGNQCVRSGETAIYSEFKFEGTVISGNIVDGAANGISMVNFNEGGRMAVCSGNIVRNLTTAGPYPADAPGFGVGITAEADTSVTGNVIEGAPLYGIHLGWGRFLRNTVANGNVIRDCGTGIAASVVKGAGAAVISDNVISDVKKGSIIGYEWTKPVTADLGRSGINGPANLTVQRNHVS